jgi:DNA repair ATPase RecN
MDFNIDHRSIKNIEERIIADRANIVRLGDEKYRFEKQLNSANQKLIFAENGKILIQKAAKELQERIKFQISSIVASALEAVFEDAYSFKIDFVERRGKIEADLLFVRNGEEVTPFDSAGGGTLDVTSFALRLTFLFFKGNRKILFLDEPFRFVSVDLQNRCSEMLKMISQKLNFQIIMVSHLPEIIYSADKIYTISNGKIVGGEQKEEKKIERVRLKRRENEN